MFCSFAKEACKFVVAVTAVLGACGIIGYLYDLWYNKPTY